MLKNLLYKLLIKKKHDVLRLRWQKIALQKQVNELKRGAGR